MDNDDEDINSKLSKIMKTTKLLENTIDGIQKRREINEIYMRFKFNKSLSPGKTNSYLKFQVIYFKQRKNTIQILKIQF